MTRHLPLVSIVMPVHNAGPYLQETLASIFAQTFTDFELIAVNDGSTDNSLDILESVSDPRLTLMRLSQPHGHGVARTLGTRWAQGKYLAIHDADDLSHRERLARQVAHLEHDKDRVGVGSWAREFGDRFTYVTPSTHPEAIRLSLLFDNCQVHASMMLRLDWLRDNGIEYPEVPLAPDYGYLSRIVRAGGQLTNLPMALYQYRIHGASLSSTRAAARETYVSTVRLEALAVEGIEFTPVELELVNRQRKADITPSLADELALKSIVHKLLRIRTSKPAALRAAIGAFLVSMFKRPHGTQQRAMLFYHLTRIDSRVAAAFLQQWLLSH